MSDRFFNSRSHVSFWCFADRTLNSSDMARDTEPISPRTETSRRPELMVLVSSDICFN